MAKADRLPLRHQGRSAFAHGLQQRCVAVAVKARASVALGVVVFDYKIGQRLQFGQLPARSEMFEVPKPDEAGRSAGDHGGRLHGLAAHRLGRARQAQGARGGYPQCVHGFAAQILANTRPQHRPAIPHA